MCDRKDLATAYAETIRQCEDLHQQLCEEQARLTRKGMHVQAGSLNDRIFRVRARAGHARHMLNLTMAKGELRTGKEEAATFRGDSKGSKLEKHDGPTAIPSRAPASWRIRKILLTY
jgi:hypothetical protein